MSTKGIKFSTHYTWEQRRHQVKIDVLFKYKHSVKEIVELTGWCEQTVKDKFKSLNKATKRTP